MRKSNTIKPSRNASIKGGGVKRRSPIHRTTIAAARKKSSELTDCQEQLQNVGACSTSSQIDKRRRAVESSNSQQGTSHKKTRQEVTEEFTDNDSDQDFSDETLREAPGVSENTINDQLIPLSISTRTFCVKIMKDSMSEILNGVRGERKKLELRDLLDGLISRISKNLESLMIPKTLDNVNIDYEKVQSQNQALEKSLNHELEQASQMELRLEHEKKLMNEDLKFLAKFRSDRKAVESRNRTLQRTKMHPLLRENFGKTVDVDDDLIRKHLRPVKDPLSYIWKHEEDEELCELKNSLSSHLRSIEKNSGLDRLVNEIHDAEASLLRMMTEMRLKDELDEKIRI
ncbi:9193_t:CDS:2 [Acaulospora morrowiae]|uniref:9193_t:CDS:1 n=1 Tax=Acaulospora morrowiae TaxID=94023 RepID=A0A9N9EWC9_9GLOM|nr:9193_t:CDS:2 [Acaulospora morrowiae]